MAKVKALSVSLEGKGEEEKRDLLRKCASTSLNSKLVRRGQMVMTIRCPVWACACRGAGRACLRVPLGGGGRRLPCGPDLNPLIQHPPPPTHPPST